MASLALLVVVVAGAGVAQSALSGAGQSGVLVSRTTDSITNIDPAGNYDFGVHARHQLHRAPVRRQERGQDRAVTRDGLRPGENREDVRCTLRRGVTFHDGSAFDSADVKHSFDRVSNPGVVKEAAANTPSSLLSNLKSVKVNGKYAVTFNLKSPASTWRFILSTGAAGIVPSTYPGNKLQPNNQPQIGTGPYRLTKYTPGQQAVFEPYADWGPQAKNDGLIIRYYSKSSTMKLALERGEIDMAFQTFTPTELTSLKKARNVRVYQGPGAVIRYLTLNVERAPTNNIGVRRALAYMMPRQAIATRVYRGTVKPLYSMPPAGLPGHIDAFASRYGRTPNIAAAKRELQRAGLQTPFPVEIWWTPTHYGDASADEYAEMKRGLERGGVFKVAQVDGVGAVQQRARQPVQRLPARMVPGLPRPGLRAVLLPVELHRKRVREPDDDQAAPPGAGSDERSEAARRHPADPEARRSGRPHHPLLASNMIAVGRSNVRGIQSTLDAAVMRYWKISKS